MLVLCFRALALFRLPLRLFAALDWLVALASVTRTPLFTRRK